MHALLPMYECLLSEYGPQGWWPVLDFEEEGASAYHPGVYDVPRNEWQRFEICVGAVLTQNTTWVNAEAALRELRSDGLLHPEELLAASIPLLETRIRCCGYYRQKTRKLRELARFYLGLGGDIPSRQALLTIWGIGPETADSILLYAYGRPEAVVDAYTTRILGSLGWLDPARVTYDEVKSLCTDALPADVVVLQEFHALMVEHAKRCYRRKPYEDSLLRRRDRPPPSGL